MDLDVRVYSGSHRLLDHQILLSPLTLLSQQMTDGDQLHLKSLQLADKSFDLTGRFLIVTSSSFLSTEDELESSVAYITRTSLFNLCSALVNGSFTEELVPTGMLHTEKGTPIISKEQTCRKISLKLTQSSLHMPDSRIIDTALKDHFKTKRLYSKSDVFCVQLKAPVSCGTSLWFIVDDIQGNDTTTPESDCGKANPSMWVDSKECALEFTGTANSYLPHEMVKGSTQSWDYCSVALERHIQQLVAIFKVVKCGVATKELCVLIHGPRGSGKCLLMKTLAAKLCMNYVEINCFNVAGESIAATEQRIDKVFADASKCNPCILLLRNIHKIGKAVDSNDEEPRIIKCFRRHIEAMQQALPVLVVCSTSVIENVAPGLLPIFAYKQEVPLPLDSERRCIFEKLAEDQPNLKFDVEDLVRKMAGMALGDIAHILQNAFIRQSSLTDGKINEKDDCSSLFNCILCCLKAFCTEKSDSLGLAKVPEVKWEDIGGLASVKVDILDTIELPIKFPELVSSGLRRSGLLFYGPPGCGKTLLAKAVATEFQLNFLSVKGPELINMYVGQSEENVRKVFQRARDLSPCVIFFDELDSLAPNRGRSGDSGGVSDRIVSQLLAELDGLASNVNVFVIGATNRPDLLDPALLRPGRFDKLVYIGISESHADRLNILKSLTRKMTLADDVDLDQVAEMCHERLTGADLYAICADAVTCAIKREIALFDQTSNADIDSAHDLNIKMEDFTIAAQSATPSISEQELFRYKAIRNNFVPE